MKVLNCTQVYLCCFWSYVLQKFISSFHLCFYYVQFQLYYDCFVLLYFGICLYQAPLNQSNFLLHKKFNVYSNQSGIFQCLAYATTSYLLSSFRSWIKHLLNKKYIQSFLWYSESEQKKLGITFEPSFRRETYSVIA